MREFYSIIKVFSEEISSNLASNNVGVRLYNIIYIEISSLGPNLERREENKVGKGGKGPSHPNPNSVSKNLLIKMQYKTKIVYPS